jgi:predicted dehydrogenase
MTSDRLKLGIIGLGIMGERLMRAALAHNGTEVVAVWDPSAAAVERLAGITGDLAMSASVEQVLAAADAVYVASPPDAHIALGKAALAAGKALFLEKPLASDVPAAREFVAGAKGQRAAVNFPMASSPTIAQLRRWRPEIGRIERVEIHGRLRGMAARLAEGRGLLALEARRGRLHARGRLALPLPHPALGRPAEASPRRA